MAHGSNQRKMPDEAVRDCLCRYFVKKRHVEARNLCAAQLMKDGYFIGLLRQERCISLRHKGLIPLIDHKVAGMIEGKHLFLEGTAWLMDEQFAKTVLQKRPKRPGKRPKTIKRKRSGAVTRPIPVG